MTFATLQDLATHHGKQAEMYLAWSHLAAEAEDAEATAAHLALHTMHADWSTGLRHHLLTMSTPTTIPPRLEKADRQRWAAVRLAKRASELARACDFKRAFRFHRAAARCTELSLRGFAA